MSLADLTIAIVTIAGLGLLAGRVGIPAIPAYLAAGILLGPEGPGGLIEPSEVTELLAGLGVVFLLFFLGLEFSFDRLVRSGRHAGLGGTIDLFVNAGLGIAIGIAFFGPGLAAVIFAAAVYMSSSAVAIKGLIDYRRLADDETDLVLAILIFQDIAIAFVLGFAATGGSSVGTSLVLVGKAVAFIGLSLAASRFLTKPLDRLLARLPRESLLLVAFGLVVGLAALAHELDLSEAIGALMAGVILSETSIRAEIEERFLSFRDLFAALFFFVFGLSIDLGAVAGVGWLVAVAVVATIAAKLVGGFGAGLVGGFTRRQSVNVGAALVARGEFTIILAQLAAGNAALALSDRDDIVAFAGVYVLVTATIGILLMKESKRLARFLFPPPKLALEAKE